jgi:hypothetical protein
LYPQKDPEAGARAVELGGESSLMEAILALAPEEDRVKYSAMTALRT